MVNANDVRKTLYAAIQEANAAHPAGRQPTADSGSREDPGAGGTVRRKPTRSPKNETITDETEAQMKALKTFQGALDVLLRWFCIILSRCWCSW